jgi:hypothetical protein
MKNGYMLLIKIGYGALLAGLFVLPQLVFAQTCSPVASSGTYGCSPTKTPVPAGCTASGNLMSCTSIPAGYSLGSTPYLKSFAAQPKSINPGLSSTIQWSVGNATNCNISSNAGGGIEGGASGSFTVTPTLTTQYNLSCGNSANPANMTSLGSLYVTVLTTPNSNPGVNPSNTNADVLNQQGYNPSVQAISPGNLKYTPLEPLPGESQLLNSQGQYTGNLGNLLNIFFKILLSLGAFTAVVMLVIGGITYMMSDVVSTKEEARHRIQSAFYGLLLIIGAVLILNTINPQLVNFNNVFPAAGFGTAPITTNPNDRYAGYENQLKQILNTPPTDFTKSQCEQARADQATYDAQIRSVENTMNNITGPTSDTETKLDQLATQKHLVDNVVAKCDQGGN